MIIGWGYIENQIKAPFRSYKGGATMFTFPENMSPMMITGDPAFDYFFTLVSVVGFVAIFLSLPIRLLMRS